jgi:hypothetical protein
MLSNLARRTGVHIQQGRLLAGAGRFPFLCPKAFHTLEISRAIKNVKLKKILFILIFQNSILQHKINRSKTHYKNNEISA